MSGRSGRAEIYRIPATGGDWLQVTKNGGNCGFESLDGKELYFSKLVADSLTLWKIPVDGDEESQIDPGPLDWTYDFVLVDDGIYFLKKGGTLEFHDFKSGATRTIARVEKPWSLGLTVSPDRRWILCSMVDHTSNDLMLVENFR